MTFFHYSQCNDKNIFILTFQGKATRKKKYIKNALILYRRQKSEIM